MLRPARAGGLWPTATAVGKQLLLTLQPASAGDRGACSGRSFLSPLSGLVSCSASSSHGLRHGPHSIAATRLAADTHQKVLIALADILPSPRGLPPLASFPMVCFGQPMRTRGFETESPPDASGRYACLCSQGTNLAGLLYANWDDSAAV